MCDPVSISAAAAIASTGGALINRQQQNAAVSANNAAQEREASRRGQARREEQARQDAFEQRARNVNAQSLATNTREAVTGQQDVAAVPREQAVETAVALPGMGGPGENPVLQPTATATGATTQDAARVVSERLGAARRGMLANAYLRAVGDQQAGTSRGLQTAGNDLAMIGGARQGSLNAYGVDLNRQPETFRPSSSMLGDALMAGGRLGLAYGGGMAGAGMAGRNLATGAGAPTAGMSIGNDFGSAVPDFSWMGAR